MCQSIKEGKAEIKALENNEVFYNPVQEFNRDISIACISLFAKEKASKLGYEFTYELPENLDENKKYCIPGKQYQDGIEVLEGLSATGLRSLRYALEIPFIKKVTANDICPNAVHAIQQNIANNLTQSNDTMGDEFLVTASQHDAALLMYERRSHGHQPDVIDLDPYGSPAAYLDAAIQSVASGGIILVTCTDTAVLCGNHPETSYAKYGSISIKTPYMHENALRILLYTLSHHASRYGRYIVPLLSFHVDFYVRAVVRVHSKQVIAKRAASKHSLLFNCSSCTFHTLQPMGEIFEKDRKTEYHQATIRQTVTQCPHCESSLQMAGPIWNGPLFDRNYVDQLINLISTESLRFNTHRRLVGLLNVIGEELDVPLFYCKDKLFSLIRQCPPRLTELVSIFLNAGYKVSISHVCPTALKSNAPSSFVFDIVRYYHQRSPSHNDKIKESIHNLLENPSQHDIDLTIHPDANPQSRRKSLCRFQENPPNWGPKPRAGRVIVKRKTEELDNAEEKCPRIES